MEPSAIQLDWFKVSRAAGWVCGPSSAGYVNVWPHRDGDWITHRPAGSLHCKGQAWISTYAKQKRRLPACLPELKGYPLASDSLEKGVSGKEESQRPFCVTVIMLVSGHRRPRRRDLYLEEKEFAVLYSKHLQCLGPKGLNSIIYYTVRIMQWWSTFMQNKPFFLNFFLNNYFILYNTILMTSIGLIR